MLSVRDVSEVKSAGEDDVEDEEILLT